MSERELRKIAAHGPVCATEAIPGRHWPDGKYVHCDCGLDRALADDPDVVKVLRMIKTWLLGGEIENIIAEHVRIGWEPYEDHYIGFVDKVPEAAQEIVQEIEWDVIEAIERQFTIRLTDDGGYEYTEAGCEGV